MGAGAGGWLSTWHLHLESRKSQEVWLGYEVSRHGPSDLLLIKVPQTPTKHHSLRTKCLDTCANGTLAFRPQQDASHREDLSVDGSKETDDVEALRYSKIVSHKDRQAQ